MAIPKLPRLAVNWPNQPEMMRRYWDKAMTAIENATTIAGAVPWASITGKPSLFPSSWSLVSDKPTTFPPTGGSAEFKANASALGVTPSSSNMGSYTGTTLPDNETAKQNIQALETAVEARPTSTILASTAPTEGASLVGLTRGGTVQDAVKWITPQMIDPLAGNGILDDTATLTALLIYGGEIQIPEGDYLIAAAGTDAGGVDAIITRSINVTCHPKARFFTNGLDNDLIRISVPSNGAGLPSEGITVDWFGGYFDQSAQKNSTSIPFIVEYPPPNPGASATCDALSIRGDYAVSGTEYSGIKRAVVRQVTTYAGDHWQIAGGDGGIFVGGCEEQLVEKVRNIGSRDLGVYASGSNGGTLRCRTTIKDNYAENSFHAAAIKRSAGYGQMTGNHAENCVRAFLVDLVSGTGFQGFGLSGNTGNKCGISFRLQLTRGFSVHDNHFTNLGATLSDGTTVEPIAGCDFLVTLGCSYGSVANNTIDGLTAGGAATERRLIICGTDTATSTLSKFITWQSNVGIGLRTAGADTGENNAFNQNVVYEAVTSANMTALGANSSEVRVDPTAGFRIFNTPVQFADGTVSAPTIARRGQPQTGIYFGTNTVGMAVSNQSRVLVSNTGIGFNGNSPVARQVYGVPTGTATRGTFDTTTVTLPELAQRMKALIDDWRAVGLGG